MQMIKLSSVVDQADDREVRPLDQAQVESAYAVYKVRMGDYPRPEEDVTPEQLAGLRSLFSSGAPPYVDLAGGSLARYWVPTVYSHSATVCDWQACWAIFKTSAIMLQELSPSTLDLWEKMVTTYAGKYGAEAWALIYQAEVRARLEHLCRVRRDGAAAKIQAAAAGGDLPFIPDSPWEWVFSRDGARHQVLAY